MSHNVFFSSRSERKHFLWRWYCRKKHKNVKVEIWFIVLCTLIDNECASLLFFKTFFSYCCCTLSDFAKVFERKRVQVAHLHNVARALSSPSRCFQLSKDLGKYFFCYLWHCDNKKNQIQYGLASHWWNSTDLGLIAMFLINLNAEICCLYVVIQKIALQAKSGKYFQIWFFPRFGGKKWRRCEHAHASYPGLFFRSPGFSPYMPREERRVQGLDYNRAVI